MWQTLSWSGLFWFLSSFHNNTSEFDLWLQEVSGSLLNSFNRRHLKRFGSNCGVTLLIELHVTFNRTVRVGVAPAACGCVCVELNEVFDYNWGAHTCLPVGLGALNPLASVAQTQHNDPLLQPASACQQWLNAILMSPHWNWLFWLNCTYCSRSHAKLALTKASSSWA